MSTDSPPTEPVTWIAKAAKEWGIFAAMCLFFIFWSYTRERALGERLDKQEEFIRTKLVATLDANTKAIERWEARLAAGK